MTTIGDLFTEQELMEAQLLHKKCGHSTFNKQAIEKIVRPIMPRIDRITGQKNDEQYLAYLLEHIIVNVIPSVTKNN